MASQAGCAQSMHLAFGLHSSSLQQFGAEAQFRVMIECVATDVATMMVNVTEMQGQVERVSGSRLDSSNSPATGVKTALHKLVTKYAGAEVAERLLGAPAKQRRCATCPCLFIMPAFKLVTLLLDLIWHSCDCTSVLVQPTLPNEEPEIMVFVHTF